MHRTNGINPLRHLSSTFNLLPTILYLFPMNFSLHQEFKPEGDQPKAIKALVNWTRAGVPHQVLLGVTGSGKTFTMANVIAQVNRPTLIISHNKTLAAQLYGEFKTLFPENAVEYFVSYYDYYQPEAYLPNTDTYISKDSSINEDIDKMRHSATRALLTRQDVIIVASVSCIYGLGSPEAYYGLLLCLDRGQTITREEILRKLVEIHYMRNDYDLFRGNFRVRGDVIEVVPAHEYERAIQIELFGDEVDALYEIDPLTGKRLESLERVTIFPASHYVTTRVTREQAIRAIREELAQRIAFFKSQNKLIEAQRIEERTLYDLEMMEEIGYCQGIENYSRHLTGRCPGEPPPTLLSYLPPNALIMIDESHVTIPQIRGMYFGDRSRKETLVEYGFRLPSALDNRPLNFEEFEKAVSQVIYVSATPADYELEKAGEHVVEQIIRPTGLVDPEIIVRPAKHQVDDLTGEIRKRAGAGERVLVTTLTKRMAEDLTEYLKDLEIKVAYLHSDIDTLERIDIIRHLRMGTYDVLVGINLLREGMDIPEVSLVAILDADKEGFLRSRTSLIQTFGRAARNVHATAILYADRVTEAMRQAMAETERRRKIQLAYNARMGITPETIRKSIRDILESIYEKDYMTVPVEAREESPGYAAPNGDVEALIESLTQQMLDEAERLNFEKAAEIRDRIRQLKGEQPLGHKKTKKRRVRFRR